MKLFWDPTPPKDDGPFHVGDRVLVPFGGEQVEALVVEDRGYLGGNGKRLYGVVFRVDDVSPEIHTELDDDRLTLVARAATSPRKPKRKKPPRDS
jgi:primosomal protein N'